MATSYLAPALPPQLVVEWDKGVRAAYPGAERLRHSNLIENVETMAAKAQVPPPLVYRVEEFERIFGGKSPNMMVAMAREKAYGAAIIMNRGMVDLFHYSPTGKVPPELSAAIGHEMGHMKQGANYILALRKYPPLIGIGAGLAGLALYDMMKGKPSPGQLEEATDAAHKRVEAQHQSSSASASSMSDALETPKHLLINAGRYLLAGALGYGAGALVTRQAMINLEFDADRVGAQLSGDPEAMIRCLKKVHHGMAEGARTQAPPALTWSNIYKGMIDFAHPSMEARIERLQAMGKTAGLTSGEVAGSLHLM